LLSGSVALAVVLSLAFVPTAGAQDPIAPPGASPTWLPPYDWVLDHRFPYDVERLYALLHVDDTELRQYFTAQAGTVVPPVAELARRRGIAPRRLARTLIEPWRGRVSARRLARLRHRTMLTLTEGHLLQHMLFHPLHSKALMEAEPEVLGADHMTVAALRRAGISNLEIGQRFGRSECDITAAAGRVLRRTMRRAVRARWTPRAQGRRYVRIQYEEIPAWLRFTATAAEPDHEHDPMGQAAAARRGASCSA
jgi:hypothetical protein